jgi:hypothetical protein
MTASNHQPDGGRSSRSSGVFAPGGHDAAHLSRHMLDLTDLFRANDQKMPDAMVTEMRRHLEGCVTTVETGMLFDLRAKAANIASLLPDAVDTLGHGYSWRAIQLHPELAGPELVAHMRDRSSIAILARKGGSVDAEGDVGLDLSWLLDDPDRDIADTALALFLTENRWAEPDQEYVLVRADVPAEIYSELVWTIAAILAGSLARTGIASARKIDTLLAEVAGRMLRQYDEEKGPFALAMKLARMIRAKRDPREALSQALRQRRYLLLMAFISLAQNVPLERLFALLCSEDPELLLAVMRRQDMAGEEASRVLLDLQMIRGDLLDSRLIELARHYGTLTAEQAEKDAAAVVMPQVYRDKAAMLYGVGLPGRNAK